MKINIAIRDFQNKNNFYLVLNLGVKEIMDLVENKHYQIACQRYFEWTHDKHTVDGGVNHPNQYFMESRNVLTGKKTIKTEGRLVLIFLLWY